MRSLLLKLKAFERHRPMLNLLNNLFRKKNLVDQPNAQPAGKLDAGNAFSSVRPDDIVIAFPIVSMADLHNCGAMFVQEGNYKLALSCFDLYLDEYPGDPECLSNKGMALMRMGNLNEALACFDAALKVGSHIAAVWLNRGICLRSLNRCSEAKQNFEKALILNPDLQQAREMLSQLG
jgi:tetratricopeptide (TPR) repeat protein